MMTSIALLLLFFQNPIAAVCTWNAPKEVGVLDETVNESSGLAISRRFPDRAYRINDSGDTGRFFVTDLAGRGLKIVNIQGFDPLDNEDMALGPCDRSTDCIFIGDIGDNQRRRPSIELVVVPEQAEFPSDLRAAYRVRMQYPDGSHDAESLAVHPDGTVYITTKDATKSQIYRLKRDQWRNPQNAVQVLEPVVALDWARLRPNTLPFTRQATSMDIAPDGKRFVILTYTDAVEFFVDLSGTISAPETWKEGIHYRTVAITTLEQEEAIAYLPDGQSFLYDTERPQNVRSARIMRTDCAN
jgi:hypothetical protein